MKITNIVAYFPHIAVGRVLTINDAKNRKIIGQVTAVWYPEKGDEWTEEEETARMGALGSFNLEAFPQIRIFAHQVDGVEWDKCENKPPERHFTIVGSSFRSIVKLHKHT